MNDSSSGKSPYDKKAAFEELKRLLLGNEQHLLQEIRHHVFDKKQRTENVAEILSDSIEEASTDSEHLSNAMSPIIRGSIRKNPQDFADALFPVMGSAIRKSINETLKSFMQSLNRVLEQNTSAQGLKWRFESWRSGIPYAELVLKYTLVYRVDEVFLIQPGSGLLMGYIAHPETVTEDSDAVSAMLSAIQDFVRDSFADDKKSGLETVELGEHTLWVISGPQAILACAIRGVAPLSLRRKLQETLERIHIDYKDQLQVFNGDRSDMRQVDEILVACLDAQRAAETKENEKKPFLSLPLIIILLIVLILFSFFTWRSMDYQSRLVQLKSELDAYQGVILYESNEVDDQLQLKLLVDPLADSIDALPEKYKFNDEDIVFVKAAYRSLEPEIALRRTKQILQPPKTVLFSSNGNTLTISGVAPIDWINSSNQLMHSISSYKTINTTGLIADYSAIEQAARKQLDLPGSVKAKFDGTVLYLSGKAPAQWLLWYAKQASLIERLPQINSDQVIIDQKSFLNWLKETFNIPESITFKVDNKQLVLQGNASFQWLKTLDISKVKNPWIYSIDSSAIEINELSELKTLQTNISNTSIYFSDDTEVVIGTDILLLQLVDRIKYLSALAEILDYTITVNLIGRVDGLGSYKENEVLALSRALWVKQQLQDYNVPSTLLLPQVGKIELNNEINMANRRVDFNVNIKK